MALTVASGVFPGIIGAGEGRGIVTVLKLY